MTDPDPGPPRPQPSPAALTSLLLGTASILLPILAGVPALLIGYRALYDVNASGGRVTGRRLAIAGMALGGLTTVLAVAGFILLVFIHLSQKSRVVECQNNLKRLGLAVTVYHNRSGKVFPGAAVPNADLPISERLSWMTSILPYLDEEHGIAQKWQHTYDSIDRKRAWDDPANEEARNTAIAVFLCPNHPAYDPPVRPAPTHYVGIAGVGVDAARLPLGDARAGFFGYDRLLHEGDLTNKGNSYTLMSLETASDNGAWIEAGFPTVRGVPDDVDRLVGRGAPFGGCHSGGMNALFVDGSVRFESESINPTILRSLARIKRE